MIEFPVAKLRFGLAAALAGGTAELMVEEAVDDVAAARSML